MSEREHGTGFAPTHTCFSPALTDAHTAAAPELADAKKQLREAVKVANTARERRSVERLAVRQERIQHGGVVDPRLPLPTQPHPSPRHLVTPRAQS